VIGWGENEGQLSEEEVAKALSFIGTIDSTE